MINEASVRLPHSPLIKKPAVLVLSPPVAEGPKVCHQLNFRVREVRVPDSIFVRGQVVTDCVLLSLVLSGIIWATKILYSL